jgi:hypothetical protein
MLLIEPPRKSSEKSWRPFYAFSFIIYNPSTPVTAFSLTLLIIKVKELAIFRATGKEGESPP